MRIFLAGLGAALIALASPASAQTISGCGTTAIAKADNSSASKLTTQADCFGKAKAIADTAEALRRERIKALVKSVPVISVPQEPIILVPPAPAPTPTPTPTPTAPVTTKPVIGVSAVPVSYYGTERVWANLAYRASEWMTIVGGVNDQNNPKVSGRIFVNAPNAVYSGQSVKVTCTWQGNGKIYLGGMSQTTYGDHTASVVWVPAGPPGKHGGFWVDLSESDGTFRNLDCREAGVVTNGRLDQRYVDDMKLYRVVRFLDWSNANSNEPITWATRSLPNTQTVNWTGDQPLEDQIEIANAAGADAWFTIPWNSDDDYVRRMATLIRDTLKGKAYFETGNEVWNWSFKVTTQALNEGIAENLSPNKWDNTMLRYAEKTIEQNKIVTDVYKAQPNRLVRVASFQSGNTYGIDMFMGFRDAAKWVDALSDAPYFGIETLNTDTPNKDSQATLFAGVETARAAGLQYTSNVAASAKKYGKLSMIYEGGNGTISSDVNTAINEQMQRSPLMGAAYDRYLADLQKIHTGPIMLYSATGPTSKWGSWGQHEFTGQPSTKRDAIRNAQPK